MTSSYWIRQAYYENPALWDPQGVLDVDMKRAQLAVQWLPPGTHSVLDLGCGGGIFANALRHTHQVVGVDRSLAALRYVQVPRCQAHAAFLPFRNGAFDMVVAMELIEHLPIYAFRAALREMTRVTRGYVLITVPYREKLDARRVSCPACGCRFHPTYHMRSFNQADLDDLFEFDDCSALSLIRLASVFPERVRIFSERPEMILRNMRQRHPPFAQNVVCPQCGYEAGTESRREEMIEPNRRWIEPFKTAVKGLWPTRLRARWWIALYARQ